jgi:hypothetical protein
MKAYIDKKNKKSSESTFSRIPYTVFMDYTGWGRSKLWKVIKNIKQGYKNYCEGVTMPKQTTNNLYIKPLNNPAPQSVIDRINDAVEHINDPSSQEKFAVAIEDKEAFNRLVGTMMDDMRSGEYCVITSLSGVLNVVVCAAQEEKAPEPTPVVKEPVKPKSIKGKRKLSLKEWEEKITTQAWRDLTAKIKPMTSDELIAWAKETHAVTLSCKGKSKQSTKATLTRGLLKHLEISKFKPEYQDKNAREKARYEGNSL